MPKYPAQIDNSQSLPTAIDNLTPVQGSIFNKLRDAVLAVESELGVKPSGSYTTVKSRLDTLESIVGNLEIIELHKDLGGTLENPLVIGIQGRPISTVAPNYGEVLVWDGIAWTPILGGGGVGLPGPPGDTGPPGPTGPAGLNTVINNTLYVDLLSVTLNTPNGSIGNPFLNIQDAINALPDGYGNIILAPGIYPAATYNIIGKNISFSAIDKSITPGFVNLMNVSFITDSTLGFNSCGRVGQITSTSTVSLVNTIAIDAGNTCLLLYSEGNQGISNSLINWTVTAHATLINCNIDNLSAGGLINMTNSSIGQNCSCNAGGQVYSCKFLTSLSSLITISSPIVYDEASYRSAKILGATINIGTLTQVRGSKYDDITVTVPILSANSIGSVDISVSGTDIESITIGGTTAASPPQFGVSGGGFLASTYVNSLDTITYVFHGPTTGGNQVFRTTWIN